MLARSALVVVERAKPLSGAWETEPYEAGWAHEAIAFIRLLDPPQGVVTAHVEISPDGIHWTPEGTSFDPIDREGVHFVKVRHYGNWLRLSGTVESGEPAHALIYWALKE